MRAVRPPPRSGGWRLLTSCPGRARFGSVLPPPTVCVRGASLLAVVVVAYRRRVPRLVHVEVVENGADHLIIFLLSRSPPRGGEDGAYGQAGRGTQPAAARQPVRPRLDSSPCSASWPSPGCARHTRHEGRVYRRATGRQCELSRLIDVAGFLKELLATGDLAVGVANASQASLMFTLYCRRANVGLAALGSFRKRRARLAPAAQVPDRHRSVSRNRVFRRAGTRLGRDRRHRSCAAARSRPRS